MKYSYYTDETREGVQAMPIYEYECEECHEVLEVSQSISAAQKTICPACNGSLKKLISVSSFHLKGNGWYSDGYSGPSNDKPSSEKSSTPAATPAVKKTPESKATPAPVCPKSKTSSCPCQS